VFIFPGFTQMLAIYFGIYFIPWLGEEASSQKAKPFWPCLKSWQVEVLPVLMMMTYPEPVVGTE